MRDTFAWIDDATENNEALRHALYDLAAHQIAAQALPIAFATSQNLDAKSAGRLIETVAGYPGVTGRTLSKTSTLTVAHRATEILIGLADLKPNFVRK